MFDHRPIIGVPTAELPGFSTAEPKMWAMRVSYIAPILDLGGLPVLLPNITRLEELSPLLSRLDGLLLAGGHDPHPSLYGATPHQKLEKTDLARDRSEILITRWALEHRLPILGICRGMQMVNLAAGGTLIQDIASHFGQEQADVHRENPPAYERLKNFGHPITVKSGSRLKTLIDHNPIWINSMHHQCVDRVGENLAVVAQSDDGIIEGLETTNPDQWVIGLQGHPEALYGRVVWVERLYADFITASRTYRRHKV